MLTKKEKQILAFFILLGILVRIALIYFSSDLAFGTDAPKYDRIAQNIAFKGIYSMQKIELHNPKPTAFYPPVYPALMAGVYYIFGYKPILISYLHVILYIAACAAVFKLASVLFNQKTGIWAVGFFSIEPILVFYSVIPMPEILIAIFLPLSLYFLVRFNSNKDTRYRYLILSGILLAIAMLTKPILLYFPLVFILFIFIYNAKSIKKVIAALLVIIATIGVTISPWIIRNYKLYNRFCFAGTVDFFSPVKDSRANHTAAAPRRMYTTPSCLRDQTIRYIFGTNSILLYRACLDTNRVFNRYLMYKKDALERNEGVLRPGYPPPSNINDYVRLSRYSRKFALLQLILTAVLLTTYGFVLIGIFFALKDKKLKELLLLLFVMGYFAMIIAVALCGSRYRFPSIPFYSILAGYGLNKIISKPRVST